MPRLTGSGAPPINIGNVRAVMQAGAMASTGMHTRTDVFKDTSTVAGALAAAAQKAADKATHGHTRLSSSDSKAHQGNTDQGRSDAVPGGHI
jgi:hypothetical protein